MSTPSLGFFQKIIRAHSTNSCAWPRRVEFFYRYDGTRIYDVVKTAEGFFWLNGILADGSLFMGCKTNEFRLLPNPYLFDKKALLEIEQERQRRIDAQNWINECEARAARQSAMVWLHAIAGISLMGVYGLGSLIPNPIIQKLVQSVSSEAANRVVQNLNK